jgi:hypothetical protein
MCARRRPRGKRAAAPQRVRRSTARTTHLIPPFTCVLPLTLQGPTPASVLRSRGSWWSMAARVRRARAGAVECVRRRAPRRTRARLACKACKDDICSSSEPDRWDITGADPGALRRTDPNHLVTTAYLGLLPLPRSLPARTTPASHHGQPRRAAAQMGGQVRTAPRTGHLLLAASGSPASQQGRRGPARHWSLSVAEPHPSLAMLAARLGPAPALPQPMRAHPPQGPGRGVPGLPAAHQGLQPGGQQAGPRGGQGGGHLQRKRPASSARPGGLRART